MKILPNAYMYLVTEYRVRNSMYRLNSASAGITVCRSVEQCRRNIKGALPRTKFKREIFVAETSYTDLLKLVFLGKGSSHDVAWKKLQ